MKTNSEEGAEKAEGTYRGNISFGQSPYKDCVIKVDHLKNSRIRVSCQTTPSYFQPAEMQVEMANGTITGSANPDGQFWYQISSNQMTYSTNEYSFVGKKQ